MAGIDNFMNALAGFGAGVQGQGQQFLQQQQQMKERTALRDLGQQFASGQINKDQYFQQLAAASPEIASQMALKTFGIGAPAAVQEWNYFNQLPPDQQKQFLGLKRAQQVINLGGTQAVLDPTGGIKESYQVTLKPEQMPETKREQAAAAEVGKEEGIAQANLQSLESNLPNLEKLVAELSEIGKTATYTAAGRASDAARRELGLPVGEGAEARRKYISKVDNEILPLLRQTFGAAFTQKEGETLKNTLGDPNVSPSEKDAILQSFIQSKYSQIESLKRRADGSQNQPVAAPKRIDFNSYKSQFSQ